MEKIIVIYGPTTSGKLTLALNISKYVWGKYKVEPEIINVDPRKIYSGFRISQSLPDKRLSSKVKLHLFGEVSPKSALGINDMQILIKENIEEIHKKEGLPILVGGSSLHLFSVLQDWNEEDKTGKKTIPPNVLVLGTVIGRSALKKAVTKSVDEMFEDGLYEEFKNLFQESSESKVAGDLLKNTLGYGEFLKMADVSGKSPLDLDKRDLLKAKKWMVKNIVDYGYHQTLDYKKFSGIHLAKNFKEAREIVDSFI